MNNYCENCGKELVNGECPNCRVIELRKKLIQNNQIYENPKKRREHEKKLKQEEKIRDYYQGKKSEPINIIKTIVISVIAIFITGIISMLLMYATFNIIGNSCTSFLTQCE